MTAIDYDALAAGYAANRTVHPGVLAALLAAAQQPGIRRILEVGCGTGNYIGALRDAADAACWGIDPSAQMLAEAGARQPGVTLHQERGEALPYADSFFDLVYTVDVVHHLQDVATYFGEAHRVLAPGGLVCTATDSALIIATRQPLATYWPETVAVELRRYHPIEKLRRWIVEAGFTVLSEATVEFTYALHDAQPYRDRAFSALRLIPEDDWRRGLARLEADLEGGPLPCISRYVLLWGKRGVEHG